MKWILLALSFSPLVRAQTAALQGQVKEAPLVQTPEEKELDVVDFQHVKEVLKKDDLIQEVRKKKAEVKQIQTVRKEESKQRFSWPTEDEFWPMAAEWWLVKNAATLKWDFDRPEYGIADSLSQVLRNTGRMQKRFRVLAMDSTTVTHLALPWSKNEYCLIFSVPFARTMDLSKLEISLLMLEDILRVEEGWLQEAARPAKLKDLVGTSFEGKAPDVTPLTDVARVYSQFIAEKGFTFQQQFKITKQMDALLRPTPDLWNAYIRLLNKIDRLVKGNSQFTDYTKMYPSPEMQIRWLAPPDKAP